MKQHTNTHAHTHTHTEYSCRSLSITAFPRLLQSPGIVFVKFLPPGKPWNLLGNDADGGRTDADADAKICASTHLYSVFEQFLQMLFFHNI